MIDPLRGEQPALCRININVVIKHLIKHTRSALNDDTEDALVAYSLQRERGERKC